MTVPLAADYPFLQVLWSTLIFMAFLLWIWLAITCFMDIFRRHDTGGFAKALWVIFIIVLPYLGVLVYLIANHGGMADRQAKDVKQAEQAFDERVREAAGCGRPGRRNRVSPQVARVRRYQPGRVRAHQGQGTRPLIDV